MKNLLIVLILLFYIFFFVRSYSLSRSLGRSIRAKNTMLNLSILFAGISSVIFIVYLFFPAVGPYLYILYSSEVLTAAGSVLIALGLLSSTAASLSLKKSWRIGIDESEKTELITGGIYRFSRNPYFLSYDIVLAGMIFCLLSPVLIITVLITVVLFHMMIIREERYLEKQHGDDYIKYKTMTGRYL